MNKSTASQAILISQLSRGTIHQMELFTFLTQEKILPTLIKVKDIDVQFIYSIFGVVNVYMRILVCLFNTQVCRTNQGEEYKLFWPQQSEFIRMAARFGAKIVPFGAVGEDDVGQVSLKFNTLLSVSIFHCIQIYMCPFKAWISTFLVKFILVIVFWEWIHQLF